MTPPLSKASARIADGARELSKTFNHFFVGTEHYFLSLLAQEIWVPPLLEFLRVDPATLVERVKTLAPPGEGPAPWDGFVTTPRMQRVLAAAAEEAAVQAAPMVEPYHLLAALAGEGGGVPARVLKELGADLAALRESALATHADRETPAAEGESGAAKGAPGRGKSKSKKTGTPLLDTYGRDLVAQAREGKIDPVIGRHDEIRRVLQILTRKTKNNPVLIGEAGVGKTAVALGLAARLASGDVPELLRNRRLIDLNLPAVVAGTKHRGEFEERLQNIVEEVGRHPEIIVFIDEIHTIVGAGESRGAMDAGNILKPVLARGEFPCLGATTTDEYRKHIESDPALERRFQPVLVKEPGEAEAVEILRGLKGRYEAHHGVEFDDAALEAAVKLSVRYLPDRNLPDKAIDLMDEAAAKAKTRSGIRPAGQSVLPVGAELIAEVVALWTGIPVDALTRDESRRLLEMETDLERRVVGQPDAVHAVAETVRMVRTGLGTPARPSGVFLFLGPTGVGKTELAKALAEFLFGSAKDLIRLDLSEYTEQHSVARLVGAPPGYIGHDEEGQLTKAVRTHPYSVVLLDEVEKAHPDVYDLFLQVFDEGRLTDGKGRTVNFTNTILIMTSNVGSTGVDAAGNFRLVDGTDPAQRDEVLAAVRHAFRPEFLNRVDEIVIFKPLGREALRRIVEIQVQALVERAQERGVTLTLDEAVIRRLMDLGYEPALGARPLRRAVDTWLAKPLAGDILAHAPEKGAALRAVLQGDAIVFQQPGSAAS